MVVSFIVYIYSFYIGGGPIIGEEVRHVLFSWSLVTFGFLITYYLNCAGVAIGLTAVIAACAIFSGIFIRFSLGYLFAIYFGMELDGVYTAKYIEYLLRSIVFFGMF